MPFLGLDYSRETDRRCAERGLVLVGAASAAALWREPCPVSGPRTMGAQTLLDPRAFGGDIFIVWRQGDGAREQGRGLAQPVAGSGQIAALVLHIGELAQELTLVTEGDDIVRCDPQGLVGRGDGIKPGSLSAG
ncbi:hypothetical protein Thi970DRAFT_04659 [Thiorhodovibrio frisius]|uniref:Uncharacterized protein n=1 Tax=Thiorhodovibrio frisius TaxID=631362 RepID=H8Z7W6_9GAMM|nr:hypothetical protein Thi970DRAFT_04659 [Thiorhodovibrio frisius]